MKLKRLTRKEIHNNPNLMKTLHKKALWLIMDPWFPHPFPHDVEADPLINRRTDEMCEKIAKYTQNLKHVKISCPSEHPIHPRLAHLENFENGKDSDGLSKVLDYMYDNQLTSIVYVGFHLGRCILGKETGAYAMNKFRYNLFMKKDLVGHLVTDDYKEMIKKSKEVLIIIV